jgi:uncharacterized protein (DUF934 family)
MSLLISIHGSAVPRVTGEAQSASAVTVRVPPNEGQGDSRKRIVPGVKSPAAPTVVIFEGGPIVSLDTWLEAPNQAAGILLQPTDDLERLRGNLDGAALIGVDIHRINDGRGYSIARVLRERFGFKGRLRAVGAVTADQVFALAQVGFDEFALRGDQALAPALAALGSFSTVYASGLAAATNRDRAAAVRAAQAKLLERDRLADKLGVGRLRENAA